MSIKPKLGEHLFLIFFGALISCGAYFPSTIVFMIKFSYILGSLKLIHGGDLDDFLIMWFVGIFVGIFGGTLSAILTRNMVIFNERIKRIVLIGVLTGVVFALLTNIEVMYYWVFPYP